MSKGEKILSRLFMLTITVASAITIFDRLQERKEHQCKCQKK